jgi:triosephosphate isomerase (TIM)
LRKRLIAGNWKMNLTPEEAEKLLRALVSTPQREAELLVCPPFVDIPLAEQMLSGTFIHWGAQNVYPEEKGAFTGEVSPGMLTSCGCTYVICGHSERRFILGENDEFISRKVKAVLSHGMTPILCVGETLEEREEGRTDERISGELETALFEIRPEDVARMVIAYEPVWAIGTGKAATAEDAEKVSHFIRSCVEKIAGPEAAASVRILYGGSVKASNIESFLKEEDIDGALIGGASLTAEGFRAIYEKA